MRSYLASQIWDQEQSNMALAVLPVEERLEALHYLFQEASLRWLWNEYKDYIAEGYITPPLWLRWLPSYNRRAA